MKTTPGPWQAIGVFVGTVEEDYQTIGYADDARNRRHTPAAEHEANARLMAAAPDLLAALEALLAFDRGLVDLLASVGYRHPEELGVISQARVAIAKAKGESL